jgi:hypothetical protein
LVLAAGLALACPFVLDVDDGEPQQLDDGVVAGEVACRSSRSWGEGEGEG